MIDDFSISGVNDSCEIHSNIDLHNIDTFCALIKKPRVLFPQTGQDDLCDRNSGPVLTLHKLL